jgi:hypothetical protein
MILILQHRKYSRMIISTFNQMHMQLWKQQKQMVVELMILMNQLELSLKNIARMQLEEDGPIVMMMVGMIGMNALSASRVQINIVMCPKEISGMVKSLGFGCIICELPTKISKNLGQ